MLLNKIQSIIHSFTFFMQQESHLTFFLCQCQSQFWTALVILSFDLFFFLMLKLFSDFYCISTNLIGSCNTHFTITNICFWFSKSLLLALSWHHSVPLIVHDFVPFKSFLVFLRNRQYIWLVSLLLHWSNLW